MKYILSLFSSFLLLACGGNESSANQGAAPSDSTTTVAEYQNPVIRISAPDPTAIRVKTALIISMPPKISIICLSSNPKTWCIGKK